MTPTTTAAEIRAKLRCGQQGCRCRSENALTHCPAHDDRKPSLSATEADDGKALVKCHAGCSQDAVIAALVDLGLWPAQRNGSKSRRKIRHVIKDIAGVVVALHDRKGAWYHPDGTPSNTEHPIHPALLPLYGSEHLQDLVDGAEVVICEGEKDTGGLMARGITAVGTYGTSAHPCDDSLRPLLRLRVTLWADNDAKGAEHMGQIAQALHQLGHDDVRVVEWPEAPAKGGAADFTGTDGELRQLLTDAQRIEPPETVEFVELLKAVKDYIKKYVVLTAPQADTLALWTAHTHAAGAAETTPYIEVTSATKRSGKSLLLETEEHVVASGWMTGRTSAAALVRKMGEGVTALIDETDAAFKGPQEYSEALRGILNNGHRKGGKATLCVGQGANIEVRDFPVFGPKMIAGIGRLPDTIGDRSITITMKRRSPSEKVTRWRYRNVKAEGVPIRDKLAAWALDAIPALTDARPEIPEELDDRAADGWEPLLAIADLAGGDWPAQARAAAIALSCGDDREDLSWGVRLLGDIQTIIEGREKITIAKLVTELVAIEDAPWGDLKDKPLTTQGLGWRLRPFGIKAKSVDIQGEKVRGYKAEWFADAFARYLIPRETATSRHTDTSDTKTGDASDEGDAFETDTEEESDTDSRYESDGMSVGDGSYRDEGVTCTICGNELDADGGYMPDGSPR